ncbi:helix-turn-helix domain-containing protein [Streptomyces sp. NPDC006700]|uniref:helix-turn-helix domain-containing protein n=1 Tax=Streptomyces sp. NPDC006700 TaxID=3154479 RepID=UPI0033DFFF87
MADEKLNAAPRPNQGVRRTATHSGVTHVRTYQSGRYVVVGNHLAQHRELSLTAIGLATHVLSLPEGAPVDIRSLADRFPEGRDRIAFALRELEAQGYLERVRERTDAGRLFTRTYAHHTPAVTDTDPVHGRTAAVRGPVSGLRAGAQEPPQEHDRARRQPPPPPPTEPMPSDVREDRPEVPEVPNPPAPPEGDSTPRDQYHDEAVALLAGLRRSDARLTLSLRDVNRLAPTVVAWFKAGAKAAVVHRALTSDVPADLRHPAGLVAHRLRELLPPPLPPVPTLPPPTSATTGTRHRPHPLQNCDGCERAFRASEPGRCRECRTASKATAEVVRAA